jgi:hypothetical protein
VRVSDEYMQAAQEDRDWWTRNVADGASVEKRARSAAEDVRFAWHWDPGCSTTQR